MKRAQKLVKVIYTQTLLQTKIEKNYIKNVVNSMSLKLDNIVNKDRIYVQNNCA